MIKGLYAAASSMLAHMAQQSLLAHNVSNMDTPGFKGLLIPLEDFEQVSVLQPPSTAGLDPLRALGLLGLGVEPAAESIDFSQGALMHTGQPLDLAIQGEGFFRVRTPSGERYTRDGRFLADAAGQLATVDGHLVLDENGQPIDLPQDAVISVRGDGTIFANDQPVAVLGLASFANPEAELARDLPNVYAASTAPTGEELGVVAQGYLEGANTNPAQLMTQMVQVARSYEAAQQMVQNQDELLGQAIIKLGSW
jgi:flagellar basal body rod protein FlgG